MHTTHGVTDEGELFDFTFPPPEFETLDEEILRLKGCLGAERRAT